MPIERVSPENKLISPASWHISRILAQTSPLRIPRKPPTNWSPSRNFPSLGYKFRSSSKTNQTLALTFQLPVTRQTNSKETSRPTHHSNPQVLGPCPTKPWFSSHWALWPCPAKPWFLNHPRKRQTLTPLTYSSDVNSNPSRDFEGISDRSRSRHRFKSIKKRRRRYSSSASSSSSGRSFHCHKRRHRPEPTAFPTEALS